MDFSSFFRGLIRGTSQAAMKEAIRVASGGVGALLNVAETTIDNAQAFVKATSGSGPYCRHDEELEELEEPREERPAPKRTTRKKSTCKKKRSAKKATRRKTTRKPRARRRS